MKTPENIVKLSSFRTALSPWFKTSKTADNDRSKTGSTLWTKVIVLLGRGPVETNFLFLKLCFFCSENKKRQAISVSVHIFNWRVHARNVRSLWGARRPVEMSSFHNLLAMAHQGCGCYFNQASLATNYETSTKWSGYIHTLVRHLSYANIKLLSGPKWKPSILSFWLVLFTEILLFLKIGS